MVEDRQGPALHDALARARHDVSLHTADGVPGDYEGILRGALTRSGLTWTLVEHRLESGPVDTLHAKFRLGHPRSGEACVRTHQFPLDGEVTGDQALANALAYLWSHALRDVLDVPTEAESDGDQRLQVTTKIPKIDN